MKERIISFLCAIAAMFSGVTGTETDSTANSAVQEYAGQTLTGRVVSADSDSVVLTLQPQGEKPEAPSGDGQPNGEQPPEAPSGDGQPNGEQAGAQGETVTFTVAESAQASLEEIAENDVVRVETDENGEIISLEKLTGQANGGAPAGGQGGFGGSGEVTQGTAAATISTDGTYTKETYTSTGDDENALRVDGAAVTLNDITVNKSAGSSSNTEDGDFYGMNAALLATNGAEVTIQNAVVNSSAQNGNGVFSYGTGTVVNISDSSIITTADNSGGIQTTGGGTTNASDLCVETSGNSSAAIRSDRGGGTMTVNGGSYTSKGTGSPAVYCTADIDIQNARLTAEGSEAVCIEGLNSLKLTDCDLAGDMPENEQNDCLWTVILYQSMSGDSEIGNSTFDMEGGTLTSHAGGLFYTTNTESSFYLKNVAITPSASNDFFLKCTGNANKRGWGQSGANGADCEFSADTQVMEGDVIWDSISTLDFTMKNSSTLTGAFIQDESCAGDGGSGYANLTIGSGCTWTVTGDSRITSLNNSGTIIGADGKSVSIVGADGTSYVKGDSAYTITVDTYTAA